MLKMILISIATLSALAAASDSEREVVYRGDSLTPMNITPTFDNGYLVVYDRSNVALYTPDGTRAYRIKTPGAARIPNVAVNGSGFVTDDSGQIGVANPNGGESNALAFPVASPVGGVSIASGGVVNSANSLGQISPGSIFSVYGNN